MCCPKRFVPVLLGFLGLLISSGYASVVSIVMVHILTSDDHSKEKNTGFLGLYCSVNASLDVSDHWTISLTQYLHCAHFAGILSTQLLGGYLASRFSPKTVCGVSILISSVLLFVIPIAINTHFMLVFVIRTAQGIFEGSSLPALNGVISAWTPESEKSRMITVLNAGGGLGPAVAFVISGITACVVKWNTSLYIFGCCGILWSIIWLNVVYDTPMQQSKLSLKEQLLFEREGPRVLTGSDEIAEKIPWRKIALSLPVFAIVICSFCRNWIFSIKTMGIPQYFEVAFTTNIAEIGVKAALPAIFVTFTTIIGGVLIDKLITSHVISTTVGRKIAQCVGFGIEGCCFLGLGYIDDKDIALTVLCVGIAASGLSVSGYLVNPLDLAPQYVSALTGYYRLGTVGSLLNTAVTGTLNPKNIEVWQNIFTISGSCLLAAAVFYAIFASGEKQNWIEDPEKNALINHTTQIPEEVKSFFESDTKI